MNEIRCTRCSRLLAKANYQQIEIKCPRCKTLNSLKVVEPHTKAPPSADIEVYDDITKRKLI